MRTRHAAAVAACALAATGLAGGMSLAGSGAAAATVAQGTPACPAAVVSDVSATVTCHYTGAAQYWTVPAGVTQATFTLYGAEGGAGAAGDSVGGAAGLGAEVVGTLPVSAGTEMQVIVGQAGGTGSGATFGGGGAAGTNGAGAGGGASEVSDGAGPLLVAGGGGGGGESGYNQAFTDNGGAGGNSDSAAQAGAETDGLCNELLSGGGGGGTNPWPLYDDPGGNAGGTGGSNTDDPGCSITVAGEGGAAGVEGSGGNGGANPGAGDGYGFDGGGGGGGGGYYGGGGGGSGALDPGPLDSGYSSGGGGGGGGSDYTGTASPAWAMDATAPPGSENGEVVISYQATPTTTTLTPSRARVTYGQEQAEDLVVGVTAQDGGTPAGTVTVKSGSASVCTVGLVAPTGSCELQSAAFPAGTVHLKASYGGSAAFSTSTSAAATVTVSKATSNTTLSLSATKVTYGHEQAERLAVRVSPEYSGTPGGKVAVTAGRATVCTITLSSGKGGCTVPARKLHVGSHALVAVYRGNSDFTGSTSPKKTLKVVR
jgi:Bacterial Ig-like domain (group 3)